LCIAQKKKTKNDRVEADDIPWRVALEIGHFRPERHAGKDAGGLRMLPIRKVA
jgi:hypothetical protein